MYCDWVRLGPNVGFRRTLQTYGLHLNLQSQLVVCCFIFSHWIQFVTKFCPTVRAVQCSVCALHSRQLHNRMLWCIPVSFTVIDQLILSLAQLLLVHLAGPGLLDQAA